MSNKKGKHKAIAQKGDKKLSTSPGKRAGGTSGDERNKSGSFPHTVSTRILIAMAVIIVCAAGIWAIVFFVGGGEFSSNAASVAGSGSIKVKDVNISDVRENAMTVRWETTVPSTSQVIATEQVTGLAVAGWPDNEHVTEHKYVLTGLTPETGYELTIKSIDGSGNEAEVTLMERYATRPVRESTDLAPGMTAPDFALQALTGKNVSLADFKDRQVILFFWEITCASCKEELPHIQQFFSDINGEEYVLLTVSVEGRQALIESYAAGSGLTFPILLDADGTVAEEYTIAHYPTTLLIDQGRIIVGIRESSFGSVDEMANFLKSAGSPVPVK